MGKFSPLPRSQTQYLDLTSLAHNLYWEHELCCLVAGQEHSSTATRAGGTDALAVGNRCHPTETAEATILEQAGTDTFWNQNWSLLFLCFIHKVRDFCSGSHFLIAGLLGREADTSDSEGLGVKQLQWIKGGVEKLTARTYARHKIHLISLNLTSPLYAQETMFGEVKWHAQQHKVGKAGTYTHGFQMVPNKIARFARQSQIHPE